jgi:hypothetical protein
LNILKLFNLTFWKIDIQRIAIVKFRMNDRGGDGTGSLEIETETNAAKVADVREARA